MKKLFALLVVAFLVVPAFAQEGLTGKSQQLFAFIASMDGRVLLQHGEQEKEVAQKDMYVLNDDRIFTEAGARIEIRFGENGGTLSIDENGDVLFIKVDDPKKSIVAVHGGSIYSSHLENVELRVDGKPEGKVIFPQKDQIIRIDAIDGKVEVDEDPALRDSNGFDSFNEKREKEAKSEVASTAEVTKPVTETVEATEEKQEKKHADATISHDPYSYWWYLRWYGMCYSWYPGWGWYYPWYYYGYYNYQYGYNQYGGSNYGNSNARRVVDRNQLGNRQITTRPSRLNSASSTNSLATKAKFVRSMKTYPSRLSASASNVRSSRTGSTNSSPTTSNRTIRPMRQSTSPSSLKQSSPSSRIQSRPTSTSRAPQSSPRSRVATAPRVSSSSRGSSSSAGRSSGSAGRSTSGGSVRRR